MPDVTIEQATFERRADAEPVLLAQSCGFRAEWRTAVAEILTAFGARPVGVACPSAVFAQPMGSRHVLVVRAADLDEGDTTARPLGFHVLVVPRKAYVQLWHNPFVLAERVTPDWQARGTMPALAWPATHLPVRTVEQVQSVLKRVNDAVPAHGIAAAKDAAELAVERSESPLLLGGVQVLVEGGKLVLQRPRPDTELLKAFWTLLPNSSRGELWPASFAFSNALRFDVLAVPHYNADDYADYTIEDAAAEHPEGRYEYRLQVAAESGDQHELNHLFERRSFSQTWQLALTLLIGLSVIVLISRCQ